MSSQATEFADPASATVPSDTGSTVMAAIADHLLPDAATVPSDRQRLFLLFFAGTLIDLVILGLFAEYSTKVHVDTFTTAVLAAIVLQILLKLTIIRRFSVQKPQSEYRRHDAD